MGALVSMASSLEEAPTSRTRLERAFDPDAVRRLKGESLRYAMRVDR